MKPIEYDSNLLIDFYIKNGLEFDENRKYFGKEVKSYTLLDGETVIGAISFSKYKNINYIEAIAVNKVYRKKGYGKVLLDYVINELQTPVYIISKNNEYFLKYGFEYNDMDLIDKECKTCSEYNVNCFPKVMVFNK